MLSFNSSISGLYSSIAFQCIFSLSILLLLFGCDSRPNNQRKLHNNHFLTREDFSNIFYSLNSIEERKDYLRMYVSSLKGEECLDFFSRLDSLKNEDRLSADITNEEIQDEAATMGVDLLSLLIEKIYYDYKKAKMIKENFLKKFETKLGGELGLLLYSLSLSDSHSCTAQ